MSATENQFSEQAVQDFEFDPISSSSQSVTAASYKPISTATTTVVKSGAGILNCLIVTGGTAGTITIYDNTAGSGTVIATFSSTNALFTYPFQVRFTTGLTIVTSAATNMTVSYF